MQNFISPENTKLFNQRSNTLDRSCEVEIGKYSFPEVNILELRTQSIIQELLNLDPYDISPPPNTQTISDKCEVLSNYFSVKQKLKDYEASAEKPVATKPPNNKRKILLKFLDNSQEDEILSKEIPEIPQRLQEEIEHCKQVLRNLLVKEPISGQKLMNYLEILYECGLAKLHSDPICLFINEDLKSTFEEILKLTRLSNTYKTFILRTFLSLESENLDEILKIKGEVYETRLLVD